MASPNNSTWPPDHDNSSLPQHNLQDIRNIALDLRSFDGIDGPCQPSLAVRTKHWARTYCNRIIVITCVALVIACAILAVVVFYGLRYPSDAPGRVTDGGVDDIALPLPTPTTVTAGRAVMTEAAGVDDGGWV